MKTFIKDPASTANYGVDWTDWLDTGETIVGSVWVLPTGLTNAGDAFDTTKAVVYISGGSEGQEYVVTNTITTDSSPAKVEPRRFKLIIREK